MADGIKIEIPAEMFREVLVEHITERSFLQTVMREALDRSGVRQQISETIAGVMRDMRSMLKEPEVQKAMIETIKASLPKMVSDVSADAIGPLVGREIAKARR